MKILIAVSSRHGSTREIADAIARELSSHGHSAEVWNAAEAPAVDSYGAAIIGSGIYIGNWLPEARQFVHRNQPALHSIPVWIFSSGPLGGSDPQPKGDPGHLEELLQESGARDHRIFVGKLDKNSLGFGEKLVLKMVKPRQGDFRDWDAILSWARDIASDLATLAPMAPQSYPALS